MATCDNCIHHSLCDYNTNISGNGKVRLVYSEGADVKCSFFQNTADVVPKSESEFDSIPVEVAQVLKDKAVEKAKTEVAREIFEEIEKLIFGYMTAVMPPNTMAINYVEFAELKKKYTEEHANEMQSTDRS